MLGKVIELYNKEKLKIIESFSDSSNSSIYDEVCFEDEGIISAKIKQYKKEYAEIGSEIEFLLSYDKNDIERQNKLRYLLNKKEDILLSMAFFASNKLENVESSLQLIDEVQTDFKKCLLGLKKIVENNEEEAFAILSKCAEKNELFSDHYLLNKVYGRILCKKGQVKQAYKNLLKAACLRPEDLEVHTWLQQIHESIGDIAAAEVEGKIISLLKGGK